MPSPEKFKESLLEFKVDKDLMNKICNGYEEIKDKSPKKEKSAFFHQALEIMNKELESEKVKEIFEQNACCKGGVRQKASKEFFKMNGKLSIAEKLSLISKQPYMNMGTAKLDENGYIIVQGVSYTLEDKFECACPTLSHVKRDYAISRNYCYCCGGHFKYHYEIMLGVKLELLKIVSSPHDTDGSMPCTFMFKRIES